MKGNSKERGYVACLYASRLTLHLHVHAHLFKCWKTRLGGNCFNCKQVSNVYCIIINSEVVKYTFNFTKTDFYTIMALWLLSCKQQLDNRIPCSISSNLIYDYMVWCESYSSLEAVERSPYKFGSEGF